MVYYDIVLHDVLSYISGLHLSGRRGHEEEWDPEPRLVSSELHRHGGPQGRILLNAALVCLRDGSLSEAARAFQTWCHQHVEEAAQGPAGPLRTSDLDLISRQRLLHRDLAPAGCGATGCHARREDTTTSTTTTTNTNNNHNDDNNNNRSLLVSNARIGFGSFAFFACIADSVGRRLQKAAEQIINLDNFSISEVQCFCCQSNHVCPKTGKAIACDRLMIEKSIVDWFGDLSTFNMYVRSEIRLHVPTTYVPYHLVAIMCQPNLWDAIGLLLLLLLLLLLILILLLLLLLLTLTLLILPTLLTLMIIKS